MKILMKSGKPDADIIADVKEVIVFKHNSKLHIAFIYDGSDYLYRCDDDQMTSEKIAAMDFINTKDKVWIELESLEENIYTYIDDFIFCIKCIKNICGKLVCPKDMSKFGINAIKAAVNADADYLKKYTEDDLLQIREEVEKASLDFSKSLVCFID